MLLQFRFENFKSFRDENSLDIVAADSEESNYHVIKTSSGGVLPVIGIFGANASGKTSVLQAFSHMRYCVVNSLMQSSGVSKESRGFAVPPFFFDADSYKKETSFEVCFTDTDRVYRYGFSMELDNVKKEWLSVGKINEKDLTLVFERVDTTIQTTYLDSKATDFLKLVINEKTLALALGAQIKIESFKNVLAWFNSCVVIDYGDPELDRRVSRKLPFNFADNPDVRRAVTAYLSSFDDSIKGFTVDEIKEPSVNQSPVYNVNSLHLCGEDKSRQIPFSWESAGTQKMFAFYQPLLDVLDSGGVLFVDELNARLHPLLVRAIINTFTNPSVNTNHAQLIFTAHEPWLLEDDILSRDEIWFTQKHKDGSTELYALTDFPDDLGSANRGYAKEYLLGKYGAVPMLKVIRPEKGNKL